ncbi:CoA pyrophosphatase [Nereida sp. MMG025]|uniref:CoA pyrophosphatase n=1 Tax=Nereida sp. MMG025 TaxID=2909981 RepID=UPI001F01AA27|nr:CoA pyrophosphatase [Nereida sp. MMG025]MCF6444601.1 CoA pyrophosphatase [Nereida sp. MMG025]
MAQTDLRKLLANQCEAIGQSSSDFDLNPDVDPPKIKLREAAVLIGLIDGPNGLDLLLTKRSSRLRNHPGQIAFPGGKKDDSDASLQDAAVREAYEEVGLPPASVDIIGTLPPHHTVTGFSVSPVVGLIRAPFLARPEDNEVEEVFFTPWDHVMTPSNYVVQSRQWQGVQRHYYAVPYGPYYIWGATARILRGLADVHGK